MTTRTDPHTEADRRAQQLGWTRNSTPTFSSCPRQLVGKPCLNDHDTCWCRSWLNDHGDRWNDDHGAFILWEPYGAYGEDLAFIIAAAAHDGLRVHIGKSVWNPPSTIGIRFEPEQKGRMLAIDLFGKIGSAEKVDEYSLIHLKADKTYAIKLEGGTCTFVEIADEGRSWDPPDWVLE